MPKEKIKVCLYGLSTCVHCRHAREFLEEQPVELMCIYVDTLSGDERSDTIAKVKTYNPRLSFPTIVVNDGKFVVVGFEENKLKKALEEDKHE